MKILFFVIFVLFITVGVRRKDRLCRNKYSWVVEEECWNILVCVYRVNSERYDTIYRYMRDIRT